jgi:FAD:protein FMN transferase
MRYAKGIVSALLIAALATGSIILLVWLSSRNSSSGSKSGYSPPTLYAMDTTLDFIIVGRSDQRARADVAAAYAIAKQEEADTSLFKAGSDVSRVNAMAGKAPVKVHDDTMAITQKSIEYGEKTGGALDVTVAPVEKLWGFYDQKYHVPTDQELSLVLPLVNYKDIVLDPAAGTIMLRREGMMMDLGGEAKGYALGAMAAKLRERGVKNAVINFGGSVAAIGKGRSGNGWVVGVKNPRGAAGALEGSIVLTDAYVSTSGDYERFFVRDGVRYCHILDPKTGKQPRSVTGVTVAGPDPFFEDVVDTGLFIVGPEKGLQFIESQSAYDAMFILEDGKTVMTPGMKTKYHYEPGG